MKLGNMSVPGDCERISPILGIVGNKWTVLVVLVLSAGPLRYNQMRREIESISQRMLTVTLRGLERDGMVWRRVTGDRNLPQVEYGLTPLGHSLVQPLYTLCHWSAHHVDEIEASRRKFAAQDADA
ncbi:winged helix-turn-helix transcriptional regulator [Ketogulonicigenium vulgare]|uniref:Predicted transcriptional regulator n=1 Tax=Ketogulonicigenium vulgare (strain WSH-001) TaxID=759362 RepID=F9Y622_KETVW|nr:helix-turn-helix domain-containing protein [Ketogulonicigenium vulgare]ADO42656.1 putative transcriptional regulator [Ketogulonicigenium vulgare Y25]AEM40847.1 predicted transcriptional regulator [Ketogulonicigenium vulgare WSH-001]ALJ81010.1 transcriptional regulator [Ketogulonicigenium vulgare]ANW33775.1 transcriptional regulator [Ketogulonicigenium vulgare]AOZ54565.1 transcriptional regulator [Ketogulonicigenium vulgare]